MCGHHLLSIFSLMDLLCPCLGFEVSFVIGFHASLLGPLWCAQSAFYTFICCQKFPFIFVFLAVFKDADRLMNCMVNLSSREKRRPFAILFSTEPCMHQCVVSYCLFLASLVCSYPC